MPASELMELEGVVESFLTYGEYEIHCKLIVESMEKLGGVRKKVRKFRILTSQTLIAHERTPRKERRVKNHKVRIVI